MKVSAFELAACAAILVAPLAPAQEAPTTFVMGTYYRCVQGDASKADTLYAAHVAPFLKAEQAAGRIAAYGWAKHWQGGDWRRLEYVTGTDMDKLLDSRAAMIKMVQSPEHAKAMDEFDRVCSSHDDYVWGSKATSQAPGSVARVRAPFALSTYFECSVDEDEADDIIKGSFAPVLNAGVKDGKIASWNWLEHMFGGKYRRVLVLDGASDKALLKYWAEMWPAVEKASPAGARRLGAICDSHTDYLWEMSAN